MKFLFKPLLVAVTLALAIPAPNPGYAMDDDDKAKLAGALLGIVIAKKVAEQRHEKKARGEPYQPRNGVMCLPEVRKCYENNRYSRRWTHREFD